MTRRSNQRHRKAARRAQAVIRQVVYDALSLDEKISRAVEGGGVKELARLQAQVDE